METGTLDGGTAAGGAGGVAAQSPSVVGSAAGLGTVGAVGVALGIVAGVGVGGYPGAADGDGVTLAGDAVGLCGCGILAAATCGSPSAGGDATYDNAAVCQSGGSTGCVGLGSVLGNGMASLSGRRGGTGQFAV